jgi:hypothetical protein
MLASVGEEFESEALRGRERKRERKREMIKIIVQCVTKNFHCSKNSKMAILLEMKNGS